MSSFSSSSRNQESEFRCNPNTRWIYDVFLSFRGEETRASFIILLYAYLTDAGFYVFREDDKLPGGNHISPSRLKAMKNSRISVIVFSKNYASSGPCLQELEKIMECRRTIGQMVVPVFLGVDPSEVRHQTGMFGKAFKDLIQGISMEKDKVVSWRAVLTEVCSIPGIAVINFGNESKDVKKVVEHVTGLLDKTHWLIVEHLVGVESRVQDVIKLLNNQKSKEVLLLGIWGMGGIGKTTIAKFIYSQIGCNYDGRSFVPNIREVWKQETKRVSLQERLLFDIYKTEIKIHSIEKGKMILKEMLSHKRVLLILDDVNKLEQLDALFGSDECFGPGSRIIITTRDRRLLSELGVDHVYRVNEMDYNESVELFSWHAFKQASPREDFARLSRNVVAYSGGLPLALEVLGSKLFGRDITEWQSVLDELKRFPSPEVQMQLKLSFDALSETQKEIFLYIACFFVGMDQNDVTQILNGFGLYAKVGIRVLEEQSLVTIDRNNKLGVHVLMQDMGREIICEKSQMVAGARIYDVFMSFKGEDSCASFTSHLYTSFENAGFYVFKNNDVLPMEHRISIAQLKAMRESRISVVVLSRNYAYSRWCLQELENIMLCRRTIGQVVVPVFYGVDPLEVRHQRGKFGEAFEHLIRRFSVGRDKVLSWRTALREASGISGYVFMDSR